MKKYILYILFFTVSLSACKKNETEPIIGDVDVRLSEALTQYQKILTSAEFGWKGYLLTDSKVPATFLFNFTDKNRITMASDYSTTPNESSYRLKSLQRPTLLFDSYSILHLLADPTPSVAGGAVAEGYGSDFEYAFLSANADTVKLEGTFNKSQLILIKSKSATESAGTLTAGTNMANTLNKLRTYFKRTSIAGTECEIKIDAENNLLGISYLEGTNLNSVSSSYYVTGTTIVLWQPLKIKDVIITSISGVNYDQATGFISASLSGGTNLQIKESILPLKYDLNAAARFNGLADKQWSSFYGFTRDGVSDYLKIRTIPNFNRLVHWIKYNVAYDLVGFTFGNSINYGPAITSSITSDGLIKYTLVGYLGAANIPAAYTSMVVNTATNFVEPQGFYVIQTETSSYDLVSVKDARTWISYQ